MATDIPHDVKEILGKRLHQKKFRYVLKELKTGETPVYKSNPALIEEIMTRPFCSKLFLEFCISIVVDEHDDISYSMEEMMEMYQTSYLKWYEYYRRAMFPHLT
jgi:hypothetical protein